MGAVIYLGTALVLYFGLQLYRKIHGLKHAHSSGERNKRLKLKQSASTFI